MPNVAFTENRELMEQLWRTYKEDPQKVSRDWFYFFQGLEFSGIQELVGFSFNEKEWGVLRLILSFRQFGYLEANLDPLVNTPANSDLLRLSHFGLSDEDIDKTFQVPRYFWGREMTLGELVTHLRQLYCGKITIQVADALPEIQEWFFERWERRAPNALTLEEKKQIAWHLARAESFERFLHRRFVGAKRFSIEGADNLLSMMERLALKASEFQVQELVVGMAHRGRLTCLTRFFEKPVEAILLGFLQPEKEQVPFDEYDGDVKYHWGYQKEKKLINGRKIKVTLAFNPSHLEAVNPVVLGMTRAAQRLYQDTKERGKVIPVLIHGDAAFAGQGIVQETFQLSQVRGYRVGGTIHIVVDNQVGFTTNPENGRSTPFASDVAKMIQAPVIHVNGDDAEACVRAVDLAVEYRQRWKRDVIINMICYRRYGHNEGDEPSYTQPLLYRLIKDHPTPREIYLKKLSNEGELVVEELEKQFQGLLSELDKTLEGLHHKPQTVEPFEFKGPWEGLRRATPQDFEKEWETGYDLKKLQEIGVVIASYPANFSPHPKLLKMLEQRKKMAYGEEPVDWGMGELLAFGSLLDQGYHVRLTGQDCVRGTFSHRHAALYDVHTGESFSALKVRYANQSEFCVYDSILSEYGVMGFEYGNSIYDPRFLSIWEAQFGDFSNGAQIIVDQFISAGETKWQQMSGLVLLLPHGFEGQGPEHSSARLERYLQLCAQNNIQVIVPTTPAQIFHAFRRQMIRPFRKPLIVMTPKSLLRHPKAVSPIADLARGEFQTIIGDELVDPKGVESLILCSGKIYFELEAARQAQSKKNTAIVRLEQLYPFPAKKIGTMLKSYPKLKAVIWAQEEPKNMGAYQFVYFRLAEVFFKEKLGHLTLLYAGRGERSSPATGSSNKHKLEQEQIIQSALSL
ncbi:MAG: 2-oxoglutarate dehydrogenase E1 component [Pseudobdellovibrionaceae bacterium]|nr:2-oxoglutarate dehydrogenase E1 component [Pseudobdellovibrionaceae bacterium]